MWNQCGNVFLQRYRPTNLILQAMNSQRICITNVEAAMFLVNQYFREFISDEFGIVEMIDRKKAALVMHHLVDWDFTFV